MWELTVPPWELVVRGTIVYIALLFGLRLAGKQQVGQLTIADLVIVLLISNALENAMVGGDESLGAGLIVALTLVVVEKGITIWRAHSKRFQKVLEGDPAILYWRGHIRFDRLRKEHMTKDDLKTFLREQGYMNFEEVELVVLETDGQISIIPRQNQEKSAQSGTLQGQKHRAL